MSDTLGEWYHARGIYSSIHLLDVFASPFIIYIIYFIYMYMINYIKVDEGTSMMRPENI